MKSRFLSHVLALLLALASLEQYAFAAPPGKSPPKDQGPTTPGGQGGGTQNDPLEDLNRKLYEELKKKYANGGQAGNENGHDDEEKPATGCDMAFLDGLYQNLSHSLCQDSKATHCGTFSMSNYVVPLSIALVTIGGELTIWLASLRPSLVQLLKQASKETYIPKGSEAEKALAGVLEKLDRAKSSKQFACDLGYVRVAAANDKQAMAIVSEIEQDVARVQAKARAELALRTTIFSTNVVTPFFAYAEDPKKFAATPAKCLELLTPDTYSNQKKMTEAKEAYRYMSLQFDNANPCKFDYHLNDQVMDFIRLPYKEQRKLLAKNNMLCDYFSDFNQNLVKGIEPKSKLAKIAYDAEKKQMSFDASLGERKFTYSFAYDPKEDRPTGMTVTADKAAENIRYIFEQSGDVPLLAKVEYTDRFGKPQAKTIDQVKKDLDAGNADAKRILAHFRDYRYFRELTTPCADAGRLDVCNKALKKLGAAQLPVPAPASTPTGEERP